MERETYRKVEINRYKKFTAFKLCNVCSLRLSVSKACEHLAVFHPEIMSLILKIYKKLTSFSEAKHKFPDMDCSNLCATKVLANYLVENVSKYEPSCLVLVEQLSKKLSSLADFNLISTNQRQCNLCGLNFCSTSKTITHLKLRHPECLALVLFLRFRPLTQLKFYITEIIVNRITSQELFERIASPCVLGSRQPIIKIEKLPAYLYQEFIAEGCVHLKENDGTRSLFKYQPNPRLNEISTKVFKKIKDSATKSSHTNEKNPVVLVPGNVESSLQESSGSEGSNTSCSLNINNANSQTTSKVICYGVEDLKKDCLRKEKISKKQMMLKKLLGKYHEKEARKEIIYWQKGLTGYVKRHKKYLQELKEQLFCARKLLRDRYVYEKLLTQINSNVESGKVRKTVKYFLERIFKAIEKVQTLISEGDNFEPIKQPLSQNVSKIATSEKNDESVEQNEIFSSKNEAFARRHLSQSNFKNIACCIRNGMMDTTVKEKSSNLCSEKPSLNLKTEILSSNAIERKVIRKTSFTKPIDSAHGFKKSSLPSTSEGESCEDKSDKPFIPKYCSFTPEEGKALRRKVKTVSSEIDSSEAEVDKVLVDVLDKFVIFKSEDSAQKSRTKFASNESLNSNQSYYNEYLELNTVKKGSKKKLPSIDLSLEDNSFEIEIEPLYRQKLLHFSTPKDTCDKNIGISNFRLKNNLADLSAISVHKLNSNTIDLFLDPTLVTKDKQLVECYCGKLNCDSLHPENFIH